MSERGFREDAVAASDDLLSDFEATLSGDEAATLRSMLPDVYDDLRRVAASFLQGERANHTLQPTALVHEAYLRVAGQRQPLWQNRAQLLGIFARMMRRILINHATARAAAKRGGKDAIKIELDDALDLYERNDADVLHVDEVLRRLERIDPLQARIIEMRFFGGLTSQEIGEVIGVSTPTVKREWAVAKRWLRRALSS